MKVISALSLSVALLGASALASPQAASSTVGSTPAQTSQLNCINSCAAGDVNCKAKCVNVPSPDDGAVNQTNDCTARCKQGDGSQAQTDAYAKCMQDCVNLYYFTSNGALVPGTTPTATPATTGTDSTTTTPTPVETVLTTTASDGSTTLVTTTATPAAASSSDSASSSSASASASATGKKSSAATNVAGSGLAFAGLFAALFAL